MQWTFPLQIFEINVDIKIQKKSILNVRHGLSILIMLPSYIPLKMIY